MTDSWKCENCGATIAIAAWPHRLCPRCLMAAAAEKPSADEVGLESTVRTDSPPESTPEQVGAYRILQKLGEGGMGVVYAAQQEGALRRRVAVKVVKLGMDTRQVIARFEAERQALALMDHPNIAKVFDAGITGQGRPFFAMEYVKGVPITEYCDSQRLGTDERIELLRQVCAGVQHAHQKGIIHRDLKPGNVLVALQDGKPVPKIIDFGVAKAIGQNLTERTLFTASGVLIGTPEYMSPEQADAAGLDVDTRTDVYSLGVMLYELLVGARPFERSDFQRAAVAEVLRKIREDEPSKPSARIDTLGDALVAATSNRRTNPGTLARQLRGDLDWITMQALEKDRTRRYPSASELSADLRRYLNSEPVVAGPPSTVYRFKKFARRHKVAVSAGCVALAAIIVGGLGVTYGLIEARASEAIARQEAATSRRATQFLIDLFQSADPEQSTSRDLTARELLDRGVVKLRHELRNEPLIRARLLTAIGAVYSHWWEPQGGPLIEESLEIQRRLLGERHPDTAETLYELAYGFLSQTDPESQRHAIDLYARSLEILEETRGPDSLDVARVLCSMANATPELERAAALYERSIRIYDEHDDPQVVTPLTFYAETLLDHDGDLEHARALLERSLSVGEEYFGPESFQVARTLGHLGWVFQGLGDHERAVERLEQSLSMASKIIESDHVWIGMAHRDLARSLEATGQPDRAWDHHTQALEMLTRLLGPDHQQISHCLHQMGVFKLKLGQFEEARPLLERALKIRENVWGPAHPTVGGTLDALGYLMLKSERLDKAQAYYERALLPLEESNGRNTAPYANGLYNVASIRALRGDREGALEFLDQAMDNGFAHSVIERDPTFDTLRQDPRFVAIVAEVNRRQSGGP